MKKMLIVAVAVISVIASIVGCQVYNPTDNSTLYSAMRTQGETSWDAYLEAFNDADAEGKNDYIMEYKSTLRAEYMKKHGDKIVAKYTTTLGDTTGDFTTFKNNYLSNWLDSYKALEGKYAEKKAILDDHGAYATKSEEQAVVDAEDSLRRYGEVLLKNLWDKKYAVLWDYNGKL